MMFSSGEPTFSCLFKRGQINFYSFSPHSYLVHPCSCHQHNPQVTLPSVLQSHFSFSYITEANSAVKTKEKETKQRKETPGVALAPPTRIGPSTGTTLCTSLTFSTTSEGLPVKGRCIDYLLPDPKSKLITLLALVVFSFPLLSPLK